MKDEKVRPATARQRRRIVDLMREKGLGNGESLDELTVHEAARRINHLLQTPRSPTVAEILAEAGLDDEIER